MLERAEAPPDEANNRLQESSETNRQVAKLSRHLSTPARIKPIKSHAESHHHHHHHHHHHRHQAAKLTHCSRSLSTDERSGALGGGHAYPARHGSFCCECQAHGGDQSAASESPSSASDSAFSQSQTTLESDCGSSDQSASFRRCPLKQKRASTLLNSAERVIASRAEPDDGGDDGGAGSSLGQLADESEEFKIIWKNLSYRVPEKRFARARAFLERQRQSLWPAKDDDTIADADTMSDAVAATELGGGGGGGDDDPNEPPLRAPTSGKPRKVIFSGLNGCVKSGQLTAILGPSGAGKTTFLKCLTNSIVKGVSGSIDITGAQTATTTTTAAAKSTSHHLKLCIIPQKDYLFDNLTVMENLLFASRIKNTQEANFDHLLNVQRVAQLLGLQACLKLKTNKLSGGQYKRVSIAQELLSKPDILILDEPTSGLDSLTCFRTVSVLKDLADRSRAGLIPQLAIIMTIHQPQIKIFNLFHHVYILSSMGQCVYEGRPDHLVDTVADCCKLLPPADDLNPASFIIALASEVYGTEPINRLTKLQRENFDLHHENSEDSRKSRRCSNLGPLMEPTFGAAKKPTDGGESALSMKAATAGAAAAADGNQDEPPPFVISARLRRRNQDGRNFWLHTWLLIKRLWISTWRDPLLTTTRISFHLIIPFVFYVIYSQKSGAANACPYVEREFDLKTMASEENIHRLEIQHNELILTFENVSLFFLLLYSFSMCVLAVTALSFPLNMQILLKETSNGWYSMPRFVMAKTIADLPMELSMPMISVALAYILTGQPSSYLCWRMLTVTAVMTLCSLISQTQGLLFGAYFMNNVQAAVFVSQASSLPWILLSGFTTRVSDLPKVLQWLSFGSIYRLGIESIVAVRYGFGMCPCDEEIVDGTPPRLVGIPDQFKSVMSYYLDTYPSSSDSQPAVAAVAAATKNSTNEDIFDRIASTMSRANTYGIDVHSCQDVRPFIMSAREVNEETLPAFLLILVLIFVGFKILLFGVVRFRAG